MLMKCYKFLQDSIFKLLNFFIGHFRAITHFYVYILFLGAEVGGASVTKYDQIIKWM